MRCDAIGSHHCDNIKPQGHVEKCQRWKHGVYPPFISRSPVRATLPVLCVVFCSGLPRSGTRVVLFVDGLSFVIRWNDHERSRERRRFRLKVSPRILLVHVRKDFPGVLSLLPRSFRHQFCIDQRILELGIPSVDSGKRLRESSPD